jgi:hypothetical protein
VPYSIEDIRKNCPAIQQNLIEPEIAVPVIRKSEFSSTDLITKCNVPVDVNIDAGILDCRDNICLNSTGCPLRDGGLVVVSP